MGSGPNRMGPGQNQNNNYRSGGGNGFDMGRR